MEISDQFNNITNINPFGQEDLQYISNDDMDNIIDNVNSYDDACSTPSKLVKLIHFNDDYPNNQNLRIKDDEAYIYNGNEWIKQDKNQSINKIVDKAFNIIVNYYTRRKELYIQKNNVIRKQTQLFELYPGFKDEIYNKLKKIEEITVKVNPLWINSNDIPDLKNDSIFHFYNKNLINYFNLKKELYELNIKNIESNNDKKLNEIQSKIIEFEKKENDYYINN